ncbi:ABC transporter permease [Pontibacillus chungwhensis BH030062]|uniref:ABC transporter permease n=1 Tax=Pontibacillus chungwhensis BH030062 TaxID=1385513 RepID=A0A0A2VC24_9BACI|nr:ABC-2 transporter permease [Pontibacillus chungwhensis]KGP91220.1 ABC transporter permease [Pontibacillus chungwhensis BH030062]
MFNLIRKDIVMQKKTLAILALALCVYLALGVSSIWVGLIFSIVMITNTFSLDEKSNVHMLLNSLPYTRKQIVSSKYVVAVLFTLLVALALFVGNLVFHGEITLWKHLLIMMILVFIAASFILPFSYQYKSQYLFVASIVAFGAYMLLVNTLIPNLNDLIREKVYIILTTTTPSLYVGMVVLVGCLYGFSWIVSIRIYEKKVF